MENLLIELEVHMESSANHELFPPKFWTYPSNDSKFQPKRHLTQIAVQAEDSQPFANFTRNHNILTDQKYGLQISSQNTPSVSGELHFTIPWYTKELYYFQAS
jgi:hypothetical protein